MSDLSSLLAPIRKRVVAYRDHGTPGLHAPQDRTRLLAALDAVLALADEWESQAGKDSNAHRVWGEQVVSVEFAVEKFRAAVTAALEEQA